MLKFLKEFLRRGQAAQRAVDRLAAGRPITVAAAGASGRWEFVPTRPITIPPGGSVQVVGISEAIVRAAQSRDGTTFQSEAVVYDVPPDEVFGHVGIFRHIVDRVPGLWVYRA
jgi:hypothetical protein